MAVPPHIFSSHHGNSPRLLINAGQLFDNLYVAPSAALMILLTGPSPSFRGDRSDNELHMYTRRWSITKLTRAGQTEMVRLNSMCTNYLGCGVLIAPSYFTLTANVSKDLFCPWTQKKGSDLMSVVKVGHTPLTSLGTCTTGLLTDIQLNYVVWYLFSLPSGSHHITSWSLDPLYSNCLRKK